MVKIPHRPLVLKLLSAGIVFGAWEIAGRIPVSFAFPTFIESVAAFWTLLMDGTMFTAYAETLRPLVVGILISAFLGIGIGLAIGLDRRFDWLVSPIFIVMQTAPLAALIPLLVMVYGIGLTSKVFGTRTDIVLKIVLPAAAPIIFAGLRLGISAGFIGAILAELKITPTGVGDIITYSRSIADYPSMYAAIASIIVLAVVFLNLLERIEDYLFKGTRHGFVSE